MALTFLYWMRALPARSFIVLGYLCTSNLRGLFAVEDELSDILFIDQVLKVLSEGATVHCEVAIPIVESTVVSGPRSLRVLRERSVWTSNPRLVFDDIEDMIDWYSEGNKVGFAALSLPDSSTRLGGLKVAEELWLEFFLGGQ